MEETIGKASLRDAAIRTGIAVDKMLALTGQTPVLQIANIVLPTAEKERERRERHAKLDAIAGKLMESREPSAQRNFSDNFGQFRTVELRNSAHVFTTRRATRSRRTSTRASSKSGRIRVPGNPLGESIAPLFVRRAE